MFHIPDDVENSPRRLTQAVLQVSDMLGLYNAELARVLGLMCNDIGRIAAVHETLAPGTDAWRRAVLFLRIYRVLYNKMNGNEAAIFHWLRARNPHLTETPLIMMVDHDGLAEVVRSLEKTTEEGKII